MKRSGRAERAARAVALVAAPAVAGAISFWIFETGDFRSSGLIAGVGLSIALAAAVVATRWWRDGRAGIGRLLVAVALGFVGVFGLLGGVPEFLRALGLFIDVRDLGPRAIVPVGDRLVIVGNDRSGPFVLSSEDGESWAHMSTPVFDGLVIRDAVSSDGSVVVLAAREEPTEAVLLSSPNGARWSVVGRFGNDDYGTWPATLSAVGDSYVAVTSTIGNDVEFYESIDLSSWEVVGAPGVFDDGESGDDIACRVDECVAVGYWDADYRRDIGDDRGVAWTRSSGFAAVDHDFRAAGMIGVAASTERFVVVGERADGRRPVVWTSPDGRTWTAVEDVFDGRRVTGASTVDDTIVLLGRDPSTSDLVVWFERAGGGWRQETVAHGVTQGSEIRALASRGDVFLAIGVEGESAATDVWERQPGGEWSSISSIPAA